MRVGDWTFWTVDKIRVLKLDGDQAATVGEWYFDEDLCELASLCDRIVADFEATVGGPAEIPSAVRRTIADRVIDIGIGASFL